MARRRRDAVTKIRQAKPSRARLSILASLDRTLSREAQGAPAWVDVALVLLFVAINLNTLAGSFLLDDIPLIVDNVRIQDLSKLGEVWTNGYWPDRHGLTLYRPVTVTLWSVWALGHGSPWPFHLVNLIVGAAVVVLLFRYLLSLGVAIRVAAIAAALFAVMPLHSEAVASIVGSAELLGAAFGLGALLLLRRGRAVAGVALFALAVFTKESTAALAAIAWLASPPLRMARWRTWLAMGGVVALALWARAAVAAGPSVVPPIDNAAGLLPVWKRVLTALWIQCLYVWKSFVPVDLAADYSYKQIPLVMGLHDWRAWCGIALAVLAIVLIRRSDRARLGAIWYVVTFLPASNLLFAIGTIMGERLVYLPSAGLALIAAQGLEALADPTGAARTGFSWRDASLRARVTVASILVVVTGYGWQTFLRNADWRDPGTFYRKLIATSPESAKAHYFYGCLLAGEGDDPGAIRAYDRAAAIFPAYSEAYHNRGNALSRLGRYEEAAESYRTALRFDPGHIGAASNLEQIELGVRISPTRKRL